MKINLSHGSGGEETAKLIDSIFLKYFNNETEDSAVVSATNKIAVTTDSFVVSPLFFKGGDIGKLSVCGTVNDLLMRGAVPKYITSAFIIEEGAESEDLEKIAESMALCAKDAGVKVIAGDTKVIEGSGGIYINTTGIGFIGESTDITSKNLKDGDCVIVSGNMGDHHAAILSARMEIENDIKSDCAPLNDIVWNLLKGGIEVHAFRDVTRGGIATVLNELASSSRVNIEINEEKIPVSNEVKAFSKILGLNVLTMGNEGKLVACLPFRQAEEALKIIKSSRYGENAAVIGRVNKGHGVTLITKLGGKRNVLPLIGEGLPRIC